MLRQEDLSTLAKKFVEYTGRSVMFSRPMYSAEIVASTTTGQELFRFSSLWDFYWELARFVKTDESHANMYEKAVAYQEGLPE